MAFFSFVEDDMCEDLLVAIGLGGDTDAFEQIGRSLVVF